MSAHSLPADLFKAGSFGEQRDPGASGTITVFKSPTTIPLVSATTETRTLARPTEVGAFVSLYMRTDGGDITVTVTGGYNEDAETTFVFSDPGQFALFQAFYDGSAYFWRKIADYASSNLSPTEAGYLSGITAGTSAASKADVRDSSGNLLRPDDDIDYWGTGSDVGLSWNGSYLVTNQSVVAQHGPWSHGAVPSKLDPNFVRYCHIVDQDMELGTSATTIPGFTSVDDGGTGTNAYADAAGGVFNIVTAAVDNDYHAMASIAESFLFLAAKKLWFEVRFKLTEATTNESAWWFGLTDTLTTGGFQADTGGPLASYDGALIWKDEATMDVDFETSNAGTQATTTAIGTFVSGNWTRVGFHFDGTATTSVVTPYVALDDGVWVAGTAQNITLAGLEEMHLVMGVKAGPTAGAETLQVDYIRCWQLR